MTNVNQRIEGNVDAVVMLTMSDWKTELRSNRYHYATRFAALYPVIFVQPDLQEAKYQFESTEIPGIDILHVYSNFSGALQAELIAEALNEKGIITPLVWIYNPHFINTILHIYSPYKIYHATEDYFSPDYTVPLNDDSIFLKALYKILDEVNDIVCVSQGVYDSISNKNIKWKHKSRIISNGCDYEFYAKGLDAHSFKSPYPRQTKTVLYQGSIFNKIDLDLLQQVVNKMPGWSFWFCGPLLVESPQWKTFLLNKNVTYWGLLKPEEVRELSYKATVGMIPFRRTQNLLKSSLPLKAFEYVATGLPVVSSPIGALEPFNKVFLFADNAENFAAQLMVAEKRSEDITYLKEALALALSQSYNNKFTELLKGINYIISREVATPDKLNVLVLYEPKSQHVNAIKDHLESFSEFSTHHIFYANGTSEFQAISDVSCFDVIVIHYSLRLSVNYGTWTVSENMRKLLKKYQGLKVAFIQDEYDTTNVAIAWLKDLGVQLVFTCVPEQYIRQVYSVDELPHVHFVNNLTGYVPKSLVNYPVPPISKRELMLAYRGRNLPFWYGDLGQEKEFIGKQMKSICLERGIASDIEWEGKNRIYGDNWLKFLASAKATLGTESGANVFDFTGELSLKITKYLETHPKASYDEVFDLFLSQHEGLVKMNQISPKIFEAICLNTVLVLFEGDYSGVLQPNVHYIPLKKDFTNIDDVFEKLSNDAYLTSIANNAFKDIVESGKYSYQAFVNLFDTKVSELSKKSKAIKVVVASRYPLSMRELKGKSKQRYVDHYRNLAYSRNDKGLYKRLNTLIYEMESNRVINRCKRILIDKVRIFNPVLKMIRRKLI